MNPRMHLFAIFLCILFSWNDRVYGQIDALEFLNCPDTLIRLCVQDDGVRLPASNQIFLGEEDPEATRGSVHVTRSKTVTGGCGSELNYKVQLWSEDSTTVLELLPWTPVNLDTAGVAALLFDSEFAPDSSLRHSGISYNSNCTANYTLVWFVIDSCGTEVSCSEELHLYDCSPPVPGTFAGPYTEILPIGCFLTLFAKDFADESLDDRQTFQQMLFSFDQNSYTSNLTVLCQYDFGVELPWTIWIADKGEDQNCNGFIEWRERNLTRRDFTIVLLDNGGGCCEPVDPVISGKVTLPNIDIGTKDVEVTLTEPGHVYPTFITGADGVYSFNVTETGLEKTISCRRNDNPKNGVSTLDLVKIQKHLLGRDTLDSPYLLIAADANNSQNVSAIDLIELRKLIIGVYTELPNNDSWRFVRADYTFPDPGDPWNSWPPAEIGSITFTDVLNPGNLDFYGIKIGDVNNTVNPNMHGPLLPRSVPIVTLTTDNKFLNAGEVIEIPIRLQEEQDLTGFQFTLEFPGFEFIAINPGAIAPDETNYALFDEQMTIIWFDPSTIHIPADETLFYLELKAISPSELSNSLAITSDITAAEMYIGNEEIVQPVLHMKAPPAEKEELQLMCIPNPWKDHTDMIIDLPSDEEVFMTIYPQDGKMIWNAAFNLTAGSNVIPLHASEIPARGLMILQARTSKASIAQKIMVME